MEVSRRRFTFGLVGWFAFLGPLGYVAYITAVVVHEVIGHGVTAWLLGGEFTGFAILPDGMGWAAAWCEGHNNIVLAGGIVTGTVFGLVLMWIGSRTRHLLSRAALLLFAECMLQDAAPYAFWNSLFVRPPGDFGRILLDLDNPALRWALVVLFGAIYAVTTVLIAVMLYRCIESNLGPFSRGRAMLLAWVFFGLGGAASWFGFDWNQLIEGVGRLPQFAGAGLQLAVAPVLVAVTREEVAPVRISGRSWGVAISASVLACLTLVLALTLWLKDGAAW